MGMMCAAVGELDAAFEWFEKSFGEKNHWLLWFGTEPKLEMLRRDRRYFELFRLMNNPLIEKQERATGGETKKNDRLSAL
jgi:hypothetical protein